MSTWIYLRNSDAAFDLDKESVYEKNDQQYYYFTSSLLAARRARKIKKFQAKKKTREIK